MKKTKINRLYDLYVDNPAIKDQEAAELLDTDYRAIGTMKRRLRDHGYIQIEDNSEVTILMPYKDQSEKESADFGSKLFWKCWSTTGKISAGKKLLLSG